MPAGTRTFGAARQFHRDGVTRVPFMGCVGRPAAMAIASAAIPAMTYALHGRLLRTTVFLLNHPRMASSPAASAGPKALG